MPDTIDLSQELAPLDRLLDGLDTEPSAPARAETLSRLRRLQAKGHTYLQRHAKELDDLYSAAVDRIAPPEELAQAASVLEDKERSAAELILPRIEQLQQKLAARDRELDSELRAAFETNIDIGIGWLAGYRNTRAALLKLAAERRRAAGDVLRARPVKGPIDYAELSREHMARYPKIRARLAE